MTDKRTRGPSADTRTRVLDGALEVLREHGRSGTTISAISRTAGLSRPTIYAHFANLEELVHQAVEQATLDLSRRIGRETSKASSPGRALVEFIVVAHREFRADPVVRFIVETTVDPQIPAAGQMPPQTLEFTGASLRRLLGEGHPALDRLDEVSETFNRFLMSVLTFASPNTADDDALRGYLTRVMLPALDLD